MGCVFKCSIFGPSFVTVLAVVFFVAVSLPTKIVVIGTVLGGLSGSAICAKIQKCDQT